MKLFKPINKGRCVISTLESKPDKESHILSLYKTVSSITLNKATVALAHRMARIIFAVLRDDDVYWGKKKKPYIKKFTSKFRKLLKKRGNSTFTITRTP